MLRFLLGFLLLLNATFAIGAEISGVVTEVHDRDTPTLVCTAHFPLPSAGRAVRAGDAFRFVNDDQPWSYGSP